MIFIDANKHYLSKDRKHINWLQRKRRSLLTRIDYADVSPEAKRIIDSLRFNAVGGDTSGILNKIIVEWAETNGVQNIKINTSVGLK